MKTFDWNRHKYLDKYDASYYSYSAYESLKRHYKKYAYVVTEVCLVDCSVSVFEHCLICQKEVKMMIDCGRWTQEELKIVLADCERFLQERYEKAIKEKDGRVGGIGMYVPNSLWSNLRQKGSQLHKPLYYKKGISQQI